MVVRFSLVDPIHQLIRGFANLNATEKRHLPHHQILMSIRIPHDAELPPAWQDAACFVVGARRSLSAIPQGEAVLQEVLTC